MIPQLSLLSVLVLSGPPSPTELPLQQWPDAVDATVLQNIGCTSRPFGYAPEELSRFPGKTHRLDYVSRLFRDARAIPLETDRIARSMVAGGYEGTLQLAFEMLEADSWRLPSAGEGPAQSTQLKPVDEAAAETWSELPDTIHEAVDELIRGMGSARGHLHQSFDWSGLASSVGDPQVPDLGSAKVYQHAAAPWTRFGQWSPASFTALSRFQPAELARATAIFSAALRPAISRLCRVTSEVELPDFEQCRLQSPLGTVCLLGRGDNVYRGGDALVIDLGGNDRYAGRIAVPLSKAAPIGVVIDMTGNDLYDGRSVAGSVACGLFGIGALFDLSGDDQYYCRNSGLGCAWHGVGLLVDTAGDDVYSGYAWCEGAAHAGVGLLVDEDGDDRYYCQLESQGLGATRGVGVLLDTRGDDRYHAYDNENGRRITFPSAQTRSHEASIVQGAGYGRRADSTDGRSLAGGVGALVDGAGNDSYYGGVFSQGIGFWWSLGMLADLGGDDRYRGVYYAQGAAAHFAVGSLVDRAGNDRYNNRGVLGQALGAGRDAAIGTFVDGAGDDVYHVPKKSAGGGDMNGLGLFCDQSGSDTYYPHGYANLGGARPSSGREPFRRSMPTIGVFVDLAGQDTYPNSGQARNNRKWRQQSSTYVSGFGWDLETEATAQQKPDGAESATGTEPGNQ